MSEHRIRYEVTIYREVTVVVEDGFDPEMPGNWLKMLDEVDLDATIDEEFIFEVDFIEEKGG